MSTELSFDPQSIPVPGIIVEGPHEVDLPSGFPNTLNNPNLDAVAGLDQQFWKVLNGQVVPMNDADITKKKLFDGPAREIPDGDQTGPIKIVFSQKTLVNPDLIFASNVYFGAHVQWFVSNGTEAGFDIQKVFFGQSVDLLNSPTSLIRLTIKTNGKMVVSKIRGLGAYEIYLQVNYL